MLGSLAMLAAMRRASSRVSSLRRRASGLGTALEIDVGERLTVGVRATKMRLGLPARAAFY